MTETGIDSVDGQIRYRDAECWSANRKVAIPPTAEWSVPTRTTAAAFAREYKDLYRNESVGML